MEYRPGGSGEQDRAEQDRHEAERDGAKYDGGPTPGDGVAEDSLRADTLAMTDTDTMPAENSSPLDVEHDTVWSESGPGDSESSAPQEYQGLEAGSLGPGGQNSGKTGCQAFSLSRGHLREITLMEGQGPHDLNRIGPQAQCAVRRLHQERQGFGHMLLISRCLPVTFESIPIPLIFFPKKSITKTSIESKGMLPIMDLASLSSFFSCLINAFGNTASTRANSP